MERWEQEFAGWFDSYRHADLVCGNGFIEDAFKAAWDLQEERSKKLLKIIDWFVEGCEGTIGEGFWLSPLGTGVIKALIEYEGEGK